MRKLQSVGFVLFVFGSVAFFHAEGFQQIFISYMCIMLGALVFLLGAE